MKSYLAGVSFCIVACLLMSSVRAHHGFTGRYDVSQPLWIEGEITRVYFGQPHPLVTIRTNSKLTTPAQTPDLAGAGDVIAAGAIVVRADTRGQDVRIEFPPVRMFFELGDRITVGDRVAVIAFRNCESPHQLRGQWIRPARGVPVARAGRVQSQVQGC